MKKEIVDYKILNRYADVQGASEAMSEKVRDDIKDGWHPYGKLIYKRGYYVQAMVKYAALVIIVLIFAKALL